jgi:hypothetical protein
VVCGICINFKYDIQQGDLQVYKIIITIIIILNAACLLLIFVASEFFLIISETPLSLLQFVKKTLLQLDVFWLTFCANPSFSGNPTPHQNRSCANLPLFHINLSTVFQGLGFLFQYCVYTAVFLPYFVLSVYCALRLCICNVSVLYLRLCAGFVIDTCAVKPA